MLKKLVGMVGAVFALGSIAMMTIAIGDIVGGGSSTSTNVLVGLVVFFGGLAAFTGVGAARVLRSSPVARHPPMTTALTEAAPVVVAGVDIALEAQILGLAAAHAGRVTATEVALGCGVSIDAAAAALDQLCMRGHADLAVTADGAAVYVVKGFLSDHDKQQAQALVVG